MEKKVLIEEINRFKLLSNYDNRRTLSENQEEFKEINIQGVSKIGGKTITQATKSLAKLGGFNELTKYFKFAGRMEDEIVRALSKSSDEMVQEIDDAIMKDIAAGNRTSSLGDVAKNSSKDLAILLANELSSTKTVKYFGENFTLDELASAIDKGFSPSTGKKLQDPTQAKALLKQQQDIVMKDAVDKAKNYSAKRKLELLKGEDGGGGRRIGGEDGPPPDLDKWKKLSWKKVGLIAGGATLATFLAWWMFSSRRGENPFPPCLSQGFTSSDLKKLQQTAPKLPIATVPVQTVEGKNTQLTNTIWSEPTSSGKGTLEINGTEGVWSYDSAGQNVTVKHEGNIYIINCGIINFNKETGEEIPPAPAPSPSPGGGCTQSSDFPFGYYQMNSMVGSVQNCVGARADNCMGPQTARAIQQFLGLSETPTSLTKDIYDKVMAKCKGSTSTKEKPMSEPTQTSGDTDDFES